MEMRENNPWAARRLRGIDACSSEDGCRPEVFAVAFRVLKAHVVPEKTYMEKVPQLRLSYHVGEDNQDVLDGLRAIDEAILFLKLGSGDRLGHATMLGVDPFEWYSEKHYKISIRKQDYLDNVSMAVFKQHHTLFICRMKIIFWNIWKKYTKNCLWKCMDKPFGKKNWKGK